MSRMVDEPYFTYSTYSALTSGIQVKCPKWNLWEATRTNTAFS